MMKATAVYTMSVPHLDQALEDFEKGNVETFDTVDEMMDFLNA